MTVIFTFYDQVGKVLMIRMVEGQAGYNEISITKEELGQTSGVIYYQLDAANYSDVKKMVLLK